jgi:catechol 2,3-dioxygenase-like lactoylglutathione lyase family enzyme
MIKGIGHVNIAITDLEKSLEFYCGVLGFRKLFDLRNPNGKIMNTYVKVCDGQYLELRSGAAPRPDSKELVACYSHLCLEVDDINETAAMLKSKGVKLTVEPLQAKDLNLQCWAVDPDGNKIEFMQMHPDSPQLKS